MKIRDIIDDRHLGIILGEMLDPPTSRPPRAKGADAIKVEGYFVQGHWRRRWHPNVVSMRSYKRRRKNA